MARSILFGENLGYREFEVVYTPPTTAAEAPCIMHAYCNGVDILPLLSDQTIEDIKSDIKQSRED